MLSRGARGRGAREAGLSWVSASGGERSPPPWNTGHVFNLSTRQNISSLHRWESFLYPAEFTGNVKSTRIIGSRDSEGAPRPSGLVEIQQKADAGELAGRTDQHA